MSHGKQFTFFTHVRGPNGWKVAILLEELGLTYEPIYLDFQKGEQKAPEHTKYNPNGRIPTLIDHKNGDFTIWESNAILLYLIDKYDTEKEFTVTGDNEKYTLLQWLFFQASGQGPYFGQAFWFMYIHPEKIQSAIDRYQNEIVRVFSVLDGVLAASPSGWLVGDKPTIADFSFITWNRGGVNVLKNKTEPIDVATQFPAFWTWHQKLLERTSVKKLTEIQDSLQK